jgi:ParB family chromosome partitioning protein
VTTTKSPEIVAGVLRIPIADLVHGVNARGDLGDVTELAASLKRHGQQQPVLVEPAIDGRWPVWDGNRRLKAARLAGLGSLMAIPRNSPFTDVQRTLRQLAMHSTARPFDPMAEARAVEWLMFEAPVKMSREEVAASLARSPGWVKSRLDLLQLDDDEQQSVAKGTLSVSVAVNTVAQRRAFAAGAGNRQAWPAPTTAAARRHCDTCTCRSSS